MWPGDACAEHGVVGADVAAVGRDVEAADQRVVDGVTGAGERQQREETDEDETLAAGFRAAAAWGATAAGGACSRGLLDRGRIAGAAGGMSSARWERS